MRVDYLPLSRITAMRASEIHQAVSQVIDGGWYLRGEATEQFERAYAEYIGTSHCIGVANGLDALTLILRAYKELGVLRDGDEVIVPANTFIATVLAITENRLVPVFVEPRLDTYQIDDRLLEQAITPRTRALMLVHLYGRPAYTPLIAAFCQNHHLLLLEDNAQAHGALVPYAAILSQPSRTSSQPSLPSSQPSRTGSLGHAAAHSFYPGKNLGALGDAGAVTTSDPQLAALIRSLGNYGSSRKYVFDYVGRNSRLDELQAAVLSVKLKYLDLDNTRRRQIAHHYIKEVQNPLITLPTPSESVYHIFPVLCRRRDELQNFLAEKGVGTVIHYPIPPHRQACYSQQFGRLSLPVTEQIHREELSIPCHQAMTDDEVATVIDLLNRFR